MTPEQIITLLQICGYILLIPMFAFMVGAIITLRKKPEEIPDIVDPESPAAEEVPTQEPTPNQLKTNSVWRSKGRKQKALPAEPARTPIVTERIPDAAQQKIQELWARFPGIPDTWNSLSPKEDTK